MRLDQTDIRILQILQENGRITNTELAKQIGISPPPTLERVKRLEKNGIIRKYATLLASEKIGINTHTVVEVKLTRHGKDAVTEFIAAVQKVREIMECHHVTGDADFLLKIAVKDIPAYERLVLNTLTELPHVQNLKSMVILSTVKNETSYHLHTGGNEDE